jgi:sugar/nucleoside kinase (ribokinase family)
MFAALGEEPDFCRRVRSLGEEATQAAPTGRGGWAGAKVVYLQALLLLESPRKSEFRATVEAARGGGALVALDLGDAAWIRRRGGPQTVYELAGIHPDILFATGDAAAELGAPLEGVASIPVIGLDGGGCGVHGTRLPAPAVALDWQALAATFCVALVEGESPVEAAGRAVLVAAR